MKQLSLVAFYNDMPPELAALILACQKELHAAFGADFQPISVKQQAHATIMGLQRLDAEGYLNQSFSLYRGESREMDFEGLLSYLKESPHFPLNLQFAGFEKRDYGFLSAGRLPYFRSLSISPASITVMGWAKLAENFSQSIYQIRKELERYHFLHGYHRNETDRDNDFYMRIGYLNPERARAADIPEFEERIREFLAAQNPVNVQLKRDDLYIIVYEDPKLPPDTTHSWKASDSSLTAAKLRALYE